MAKYKSSGRRVFAVAVVAVALALTNMAGPATAAVDLLACTPGNIVVDGGLEQTNFANEDANPNWVEDSSIFGTPLCSALACGSEPTAGPRTGTFWAWFGGDDLETSSSLSQTVTFPTGATSVNLNFYLRIGAVASPFTDTLQVKVDNVTQTTFTEPSSAQGSYTQRTVNLLPFANGLAHTISFVFTHPSGENFANFSVDDITLDVVCGTAPTAKDSVGIFTTSTNVFNLRNANVPGPADLTFSFGTTGDLPMKGDWDNDGDDTIGVYRPSTSQFFLRNSNTPGGPDITVQFGGANPNFVPVAGDWDGDGDDTIGLYDRSSGAFFLRNSNSAGNADLAFSFGPGGSNAIPITGDWDNNGTDTIGFYVTTTGAFFLRNSNSAGVASSTFTLGSGGSFVPVAGDWDNDGDDSVGIYQPTSGAFFLKNTLASGASDITFVYGAGNQTPLAGDWDNLP